MQTKGLVLVVIDGLTPSVFEQAVESGDAPALAFLAAHGRYARATSTFPSLTPVCVSSIATGAHPDVHHIPHLVWFDRDERRVVEYGSSLGAIVAAGTRRALVDTIFDLSARHLSSEATTVFEALDDAGLVTAAVNFTCYRGRTEHRATLPGVNRTVRGPRRFFFYNLFESDVTGAPLAVRRRAAGSIDEYAAAVGRWLVARDGFDFFVFYLADYDYASHALGPENAGAKLADADRAVGSLMDVAGGPDAFLDRYAVVLCSDHGQSLVKEAAQLELAGGLVTASNRAAMVYGDDPRRLAEAFDREPAVDVALFLEDGEVVARRHGDEDAAILDAYPDGRARAEAALRNPNAGEVVLSAAPGYEFVDLAGRHHQGGGSHGSLAAGDSEVPMLTLGTGPPPASITGIKGLLLEHFLGARSEAA